MRSYDFFVHSLNVKAGVSTWVVAALIICFLSTSAYVVVEDYRHKRIPNWFSYGLIVSGLALAPVLYADYGTHYIVGAITLVVFAVFAEVSRGGLGYGDVKLYAGLALYYSYLIIPIVALGNILALIAGTAIAAYQGKNIRKFPVPMAPSIIVSVIIVTAAVLAR